MCQTSRWNVAANVEDPFGQGDCRSHMGFVDGRAEPSRPRKQQKKWKAYSIESVIICVPLPKLWGELGKGLHWVIFFTRLILIEFIQYWHSMIHKGHVLAPTSTGTGAWIRLQGCAPGGRMFRAAFLCLVLSPISVAACYIMSWLCHHYVLLCYRYHVVFCLILPQSEARRIFESRQQRLRGLPKVEAPTWENFHCVCDWVFCLSKFRCSFLILWMLLVSLLLFSLLVFICFVALFRVSFWACIKPAVQPTTFTTVKHFASLGDWTITEFAG